MRRIFALSAASALALALSACGSPAEEEAVDVEEAPAEELVTDLDAETGTAVPGEEEVSEDGVEEVDPEPTPSPAPTPTATPTRTAAPTPVAAVAQPASFATCAVCHSVERGQNGIGPTLAGVVGRRAGSVPGANYSPAMEAATLSWTEANLERYLADPHAVVPGTTMPPPGLNPAQRRAVINYLKTL